MLKASRADMQGVPVLELIGRLDSMGAATLDQALAELPTAAPAILIDMAQVRFLSSAGIRVLLLAAKRQQVEGGSLVLANLDQQIAEVLDLAGLLGAFTITTDLHQAAAMVALRSDGADRVVIEDRAYLLQGLADEPCMLDLWGPMNNEQAALTEVNLADLGVAMGHGALGDDPEHARLCAGDFVSLPGFFGVGPHMTAYPFDYALTRRPERSRAWVSGGYGVEGPPSLHVQANGLHIDLERATGDIVRLVNNTPLLFVAGVLRGAGKAVFISGLITNRDQCARDVIWEQLCADVRWSADGEYGYRLHGVHLHELPEQEAPAFEDVVRQALRVESVAGAGVLKPDFLVEELSLWLWTPTEQRPAHQKRMRIEADVELPLDWERIVRRIYEGDSRVVLHKLPGGFTSHTFRVTSYDAECRRLLPTVLKLGGHEVTHAEEEAYHQWVKPFILNNSTSILGTHSSGEWSGLRYNFVGIDGGESTLVMLREVYQGQPVEEVLALFDRVFTDILKPWYGQPRWEEVDLLAEHDPRGLFPNLLQSARDFGIDVDAQTIYCPPLERSLPNPYWFLAHRWGQGLRRMWYRCVCHGDLNLQNIMLDSRQNIYVIDFSETHPRNCVSDFARLEPIAKMEFTRLQTEEDLAAMLRFEEGLQQVSRLNEEPPNLYTGNDPMVHKAWATICRMRHYADRATLFETDLVPWLLAVLEWTLPVVAYVNVGSVAKWFAVYSAGLLVERLQALGNIE